MSTSRIKAGIARMVARVKRSSAPEPAPAVTPEQTLALALAHLAYLGYAVDPPEPDGWNYARHPQRYDFGLRVLPWGIRLHCEVIIGAAATTSYDAWLAYLNTANDAGRFTRFSLAENRDGVHVIKMRAFAGPYHRDAFAMTMDMWHDDLDWLRRNPNAPERETPQNEHSASVTIN